MSDIVQYLIDNYIWILSIIIVILLAIIGYFADKIKLGQIIETDKKPTDDELINNIKDKQFSDLLGEEPKEEKKKEKSKKNKKEEVVEEIEKTTEEIIENPIEDIETPVEEVTDEIVEVSKEEPKEEISFDEVFNEVIPVKSLMDDDFITDIENLTIDNKKNKTTEIPDLDDIELPKIESLAPEQEDIWRF